MMRGILIGTFLLASLSTSFIGCSDGLDDEQTSTDDYDIEVPDEPTYHRDIKPLMEDHCTGCHADEAIAPFSLDDYDDVADVAPIALAAMHA